MDNSGASGRSRIGETKMKTDVGNLFFDGIIVLILVVGIVVLTLQALGLMNVYW